MESWVQRWQPRTNALCDFSTTPVEITAPATKNRCQVIRSAAPVTQNHLRKSTYLMLQNATRLRKSAPWTPNISDEHVSCIAPARRNASLQILFKCPTPAIVSGNATKPWRFARFWRGAQSLAPATQRHLNLQKWSEPLVLFTFSHWHVLRATTACTFSTSELPKVVREWCLVHFDLEMCFAPQRRALFRYLNFQKWSENGVSCTFWLGNVLRATTACTFSTSQLPKVVRTPSALYIMTWKCASRHNGVHFFDIASLEKHSESRRSYLFSHLYLLSSYSFSSTLLSSNLSLLFASSLLCFSSVHIVGSLTSKLPSIIVYALHNLSSPYITLSYFI